LKAGRHGLERVQQAKLPPSTCPGWLLGQWLWQAEQRPLVLVLTLLVPFQRSGARVREAVRNVFVVIAALALLGAQALSTLHFVLVPHHLCALHGVLEDGGKRPSATAPEGGSRSSDSVEVSDQSEQDEHDACSVATRSEHGVLLQRPALGRATLGEACVASASAGLSLKLTRALLLSRAPKTSPPARA
jgi:hypothetical protein